MKIYLYKTESGNEYYGLLQEVRSRSLEMAGTVFQISADTTSTKQAVLSVLNGDCEIKRLFDLKPPEETENHKEIEPTL